MEVGTRSEKGKTKAVDIMDGHNFEGPFCYLYEFERAVNLAKDKEWKKVYNKQIWFIANFCTFAFMTCYDHWWFCIINNYSIFELIWCECSLHVAQSCFSQNHLQNQQGTIAELHIIQNQIQIAVNGATGNLFK